MVSDTAPLGDLGVKGAARVWSLWGLGRMACVKTPERALSSVGQAA